MSDKSSQRPPRRSPQRPGQKPVRKNSGQNPDEPFGGFGKTFGRRKGRPLRAHHASLVEELLPQIEITLPSGPSGEVDVVPESLDPFSLFGTTPPREIWLEVGYGGGEHLAGQAAANPDVGIIGCEFFTAGVGKMLAHLEALEISNVRLFTGDARQLLACLTASSLTRIFVLYPDPWPKLRHERRRFISPWAVSEFARLVATGGVVRVVSDIPVYCRWTLQHFGADARFSWQAEGPGDWREPPEDWVSTRYEAKALREGRTPAYLDFRRREETLCSADPLSV